MTEEHKKKISESNKGRVFSDEHRKKISIGRLKFKQEHGYLLSQSARKKCSRSLLGHVGYWKGKERPEIRGEKSHQWKGGVTKINKLIRNSSLFSNWRDGVFQRDEWKCVDCGSNKNIHPHHIKELSDIVRENNIKSIKDAYACSQIKDVSNGITLCSECHLKKHGKIRNFSNYRTKTYICSMCGTSYKSKNRNSIYSKTVNKVCSRSCLGKLLSIVGNSGQFKKGVFIPTSRNTKGLACDTNENT